VITPDSEANIPILVGQAIQSALLGEYPDVPVFLRHLRTTDGTQVVGVLCDNLDPQESTKEIGHGPFLGAPAFSAPTMRTYNFQIEALVTDTDNTRGISTHHAMAAWIYRVLAYSEPLRVALAVLSISSSGFNEKVTRWDVRKQHYRDNTVKGRWLAMSVTEFWVETVSTREM